MEHLHSEEPFSLDPYFSNKIEVRGKKNQFGYRKLDKEARAGNSGLKITFCKIQILS